jgi:hypothetical protein
VQATRRKRAKLKKSAQKIKKCQKNSARGNFKTAPKQEKLTNARVLLRANDVGGVQMKSETFAPLTSEVDDGRSTNKHRTIHWKRGKTGLFKNVEN